VISQFQTGLRNVLDSAVLDYGDSLKGHVAGYRKIDEIPFDFVRRMMSVLVEKPDKDRQLLTKGAPEAVFPCCKSYELDGQTLPLEPARAAELIKHYEELNAEGFRVLAVAHKPLKTDSLISKADERDLILKATSHSLIRQGFGRASDRRTAKARSHCESADRRQRSRDPQGCREVGLNADEILLGSKVER